jgi:phosphohistidine swiveling domain-containing protein
MDTDTKPRSEMVHFTITGEGFTRLARDMFLSEKVVEAWRLITKGLSGANLERIAQDVLDGKQKFVGNETDGINAVPDTDPETEEYREQVRYIFAGRCRLGDTWWRPRAKVETFGPDDARWAMEHGARLASPFDGSGAAERFHKKRVEFYARDGECSVECSVDCQVGRHGEYFIFAPCGEPPFWWDKQTNNPTKALEDFLAAGRSLQTEGYFFAGAPSEGTTVCKKAEADPEKVHFDEHQAKKREQWAREDAEADAAEARDKRWRADLRERILAQAAGDLFELKYEGGSAMVPRAPFVHWAIDRTAFRHLAPEWNPISPMGLKLMNDDPWHSDWLIGAGLNLGDAYQGAMHEAALEEMFRVQQRLAGFKCTVIVDGAEVTGTVGKDILVLPNLKPDHLPAMLNARAVITEAGGKLAHLAQIALERSIPIVLVPDACTRYPEGLRVTINAAEGEVEIHQ